MKMIFVWILLVGLTVVMGGCAMLSGEQFGARAAGVTPHENSTSSNYRDGSFVNLSPVLQTMGWRDLLKNSVAWFIPDADRSPTQTPPVKELPSLRVDDGRSHVTWLGHSTILIEMDGQTILTDPVFSGHASPFPWLPPKSFFPDMPIALEKIDRIDVVLISHDHYDHLDHQTIVSLAHKADTFVTPLGVGNHLRHWGVGDARIVELDWWRDVTLHGITFTATPARHFSGRGLSGGNQTLWAGWAIRGAEENLYFGGDTGYFPEMREIGERLGPFDLAMLECGAYNEAWSNIHMMPEQTYQAHLDLKGARLLPIHWGRFDLALHAWDEPIERLLAAHRGPDNAIVRPFIGERFSLDGPMPERNWWKQPILQQTEDASPAQTPSPEHVTMPDTLYPQNAKG